MWLWYLTFFSESIRNIVFGLLPQEQSLELCGCGGIAVLYHPLHRSGHGFEGIKKQPEERSSLFCSISSSRKPPRPALRTLYLSCCCPSCPPETAASPVSTPDPWHISKKQQTQPRLSSEVAVKWAWAEPSESSRARQTGLKQRHHKELNQWRQAVWRWALQCWADDPAFVGVVHLHFSQR